MCVYCLFSGGEIADRLIHEDIPVRVYSGSSRLERVNQLKQWLHQDKIQAAHFHNASATIFGAPAAHWAKVGAVVSTRHGLVAPPYRQKQEALYAVAVRYSRTAVVGVCEATSRNLRGIPLLPKENIRTIYNGAVPAYSNGEDLRSQKDGFTFVTVGRLAPPKDHSGLIQAFAKSLGQRSDLRLWIVGDGVLRPDLEKQVHDLGIDHAVRFWGSRQNVGDFLKAADCFTLISRSEGLPVSQLEAMAEELPLIVSDAGAMPELINMGNCGWVVPVGGTDALSRVLVSCAEDAELRKEYGLNARSTFENHFQLEKMALTYEDLYRQ